MILVLLGTQNKPFSRILKAISKEINNGNIKDKVIAQIGCTEFDDQNMELFDYKDKEELNKLIKKADVVITHGGVGTIIECLDYNKKIIAVPRLKKYKEHTNDHQLQIVEEFSKLGFIKALNDFDKLPDLLKEIKTFKPAKFKSNNENFKNKVKEYIDSI